MSIGKKFVGTIAIILGVITTSNGSIASDIDDGMSEGDRRMQSHLEARTGSITLLTLGGEGHYIRAHTEEELAEIYIGQTNRYYEPGHGVQIEYTAPDGNMYLWYPGNRQVVTGTWRLDGETHICFNYQSNSRNPLTGNSGGRWECQYVTIQSDRITERAAGDLFGLAEREMVPFRLQRRDDSDLGELVEKISTGEFVPEEDPNMLEPALQEQDLDPSTPAAQDEEEYDPFD